MNLKAINSNLSLWIKAAWSIFLFILKWALFIPIILLSSIIWLPITIWKTGMIVSDHIIKSITDD